jgi:hypothetical protein
MDTDKRGPCFADSAFVATSAKEAAATPRRVKVDETWVLARHADFRKAAAAGGIRNQQMRNLLIRNGVES